MTVSVVLLVHNEAETIQQEIRSFHDCLLRDLPDAELVIAEDGSRDGSRDRILEVAKEIPLRLLSATERLGYGGALVSSLENVRSEWVCFFDTGLKHDPADFWKLWNAREGFDVVLGWRTQRTDQLHRRVLTICFNALVRGLFGVPFHDMDTGLRLLRRDAVYRAIGGKLTFRGFCSAELVLKSIAAGCRVTEVPVHYRQRVGESRGLPTRAIVRSIARSLGDLWRLRRSMP